MNNRGRLGEKKLLPGQRRDVKKAGDKNMSFPEGIIQHG